MRFPWIQPRNPDALAFLLNLQIELIAKAEERFGKRDASKIITRPIFSESLNPYIMNTRVMRGAHELYGAHAVLTQHAAEDWRSLVYELAHETVHLLDPLGTSSWLEEGVAVAFSIEMTKLLAKRPIRPSKKSNYHLAFKMVMSLPAPLSEWVPAIRRRFGKMSGLKAEHLSVFFPDIEPALATKLCAPFPGCDVV